MSVRLELIGVEGRVSDVFNNYLTTDDPCFGKRYSKEASECRACVLPVVSGGQVVLLREACVSARANGGVVSEVRVVKRLTSREVLERIHAGKTGEEIYKEVLNRATGHEVEARQLVYDRLWYLEKEKKEKVPTLPSLKELSK